MMLELLRDGLRRAGVPVARMWRDDYHPQSMEPVEKRTQPSTGWFGGETYEAHFYPTILRWLLDDGSTGSMMLNPILRKVGGRWREDGEAQARKFFDLIRDHYGRPRNAPETGGIAVNETRKSGAE